ncbi:MAG: hypothetical protein EAZ27_11655 [Cytophagales bacterium]|nr:MAG: hypothetical protein EAZ27_11655 [Cytophagales bacterium]
MKVIIYIFLLVFFYNCKSNQQLVCVWKGEESFIDSTISNKKWVFNRFKNGEYSVNFKYNLKGRNTELTETGKWKTKKNVYYVNTKQMRKFDTFIFEIINDSTIKFTAIKLDESTDVANRENYSFIDHKIK